MEIDAKNVSGFAAVDSNLYTISDGGDILEIDMESGESAVALPGAEISGKIIAITNIEDTNTLAIFTDKPQVYNFDTERGGNKK